jgi:hypothetical protein
MTSARERKAAERQRRKDAGLVLLQVWVPPHVRDEARKAVKEVVERDRAARLERIMG